MTRSYSCFSVSVKELKGHLNTSWEERQCKPLNGKLDHVPGWKSSLPFEFLHLCICLPSLPNVSPWNCSLVSLTFANIPFQLSPPNSVGIMVWSECFLRHAPKIHVQWHNITSLFPENKSFVSSFILALYYFLFHLSSHCHFSSTLISLQTKT